MSSSTEERRVTDVSRFSHCPHPIHPKEGSEQPPSLLHRSPNYSTKYVHRSACGTTACGPRTPICTCKRIPILGCPLGCIRRFQLRARLGSSITRSPVPPHQTVHALFEHTGICITFTSRHASSPVRGVNWNGIELPSTVLRAGLSKHEHDLFSGRLENLASVLTTGRRMRTRR